MSLLPVKYKTTYVKKTPVVVKTVDEVLSNPPEWEKIALATRILDKELLKVLNDAIKKYDKEIRIKVNEFEAEPRINR